ncbi:aminoglycoside phosphotransferase family protein [Cellulomonas cellasea]|uniref:Aminoglycoside phosphotransferase (APT) family kinase protein n=1 Tax=Cellulomonas cellasea TaxID=43670 RepID=A0A7W4UHZ2_9CELL|nr:aminoglycoside phosphotransferase family protein [Cellulomonas cellasea]MBB2924501.1 aminoglycoside phosphotransferase (APT) family kinase protein [Cellulomonas cellasea]
MLDETADVRDDAVPPQTRHALARVLAPLGEPARVELLTGGTFATTYRVTLTDGARVVVKTAPTDAGRLLRYEHDLVRTEAQVYTLAAERPDLLMPRVLLTDFSRTVLPSDVVVVSHLDGVPLVDLGEPAPAVGARVDHDLGAFMARLHTVTGDRFGYLNAGSGLHAPTWPEAFGLMLGALLDDAARWGTPVPDADVRAALARHTDALAEVTTPVLVHGDLWAGNLFVEPATGELVGVIDTERSLWADPLYELIGADQMGTRTAPTAVLDGYASAGGAFALDTAAGRTRLQLYRLYLSLVLIIEIAPRAYTGDWIGPHRATAERLVREALDVLLGR